MDKLEVDNYKKMIPNKDFLILKELRNNSREKITKISKKTAIPASTIYDKIKKYEPELITKHTTMLDFSRLGFDVKANIMLKAGQDSREKIKEFLIKHKNVNSLSKVSEDFDFLIEAIFKDKNQMNDFMHALVTRFDIEKTKIYRTEDELKKESFLNSNDHLSMTS